LAQTVLLDTHEHIKYFSQTFSCDKKKFVRSVVGTDDEVFYPRRDSGGMSNFTVHFHGGFVPLQGVEYIVKTADILKNKEIIFRIIGKGQDYKKVKGIAGGLNLSNIVWIDRVDYNELPFYISNSDVCLGIFGDTGKAQRVIPNKVYEAISMAKPVISGDTPAIRELFTDRENILLCKVADPDDLAQKILEIKDVPDLRDKIANNGYEIFKNDGVPKAIGVKLLAKLKIVLKIY